MTAAQRAFTWLKSPWFQGLALYGFCFGALAVLIFAIPGFLGNDDYYHARISALIIEQGRLALDFPWLPQTLLSPERFVDHHLLFHLYLAPWAYFGGLTGAKLGAVSLAAAAFLAAWVMLRGIGARFAAMWTIALLGVSTPFLYRMLMVRVQSASLLLLIVGLHILFQRRYRWLMPLAFAYTWLYQGFVLLPIFCGLYVVSQWITDRKWTWQPLIYCAIGIALGLVINPYFPQNIVFIVEHMGAKVDFESGVRVGNEWYPYETSELLIKALGAWLVVGMAILRPSFGGRRDRIETTLLFVTMLTLVMLFRSRRFIEYFPAFALLFCAAAWGRGAVLLRDWLPRWSISRLLVTFGVLLVFSLLISVTFIATYASAQTVEDFNTFVGASAWLRENTPPGALVFQTEWGNFPRLFFYNTHNTYLVGLDPILLELADQALWDEWIAIINGQVEQPAAVIHDVFGASYVISDRQRGAFVAQAQDDPNMRLVYRDEDNLVWEIIPDFAVLPAEEQRHFALEDS